MELETHGLFIAVAVALGVLDASLILSIASSFARVWPPPRRSSWQYWFTWSLFSLGVVGILGLGVLDWNGLALPAWLRIGLGLGPMGLGIAFGAWAVRVLGVRATQGLGGELATSGPYRYSRNPQYVGNVALLLGYGVLAASGPTLIAAALLALWFLLAPFAEEPWLREQIGPSYDEYLRSVPRFLGLSRGHDRPVA